LWLFLAIASARPLEKLIQKVATPSVSLLQGCQEGNPILLETGNLPANGRAAGDPCATDEQCATGLTCLCQATGGKECTDSCVVQGVVIPNDGQDHDVLCFGRCRCLGNGGVGCVDMCPAIAIDCQAGYHQVTTPPAPGQCCSTLSCEPDACCDPLKEPGKFSNPICFEGSQCCPSGEWACSIGDGKTFSCNGQLTTGPFGVACAPDACCDPLKEPGKFSNPICFEGSQCCRTGEWACSIGDGKTFSCNGQLTTGPFGVACAPECDGGGQTCGGIANLQCTGESYCVDNPNDGCDPQHGGADCGGVCHCAVQLDQSQWTAVGSGEWSGHTANNLAQNKGSWNSGNWPEGWITIYPTRPTFVHFVRLHVDQLPTPAVTTHVFSVSTVAAPTLTPIKTIHGTTAANDWIRIEVNQEITAFQAKTTVSPSWVAWLDADFY